MLALSKMVREEEAIYGQISDEEWEAIRLTKEERRTRMLQFMRVFDKLEKYYSYKLYHFSIFSESIERFSNV